MRAPPGLRNGRPAGRGLRSLLSSAASAPAAPGPDEPQLGQEAESGGTGEAAGLRAWSVRAREAGP